jgi:hypothetical protein
MISMPFGRYRGQPLEKLPEPYLQWLLTLDLREPLRRAVYAEHERRTFSQESHKIINPGIIDELVGAGLRTLSKKYHPDCGGDHERMAAVNAAAAWVRQQARSLA